MPELDMDAAAAARREVTREPKVARFKGHTFTLPDELPWEVSEAVASMATAPGGLEQTAAMVQSVKALLGDQYAEFAALAPTQDDVDAFGKWATDQYGAEQGESPASAVSSLNTGAGPRRPSKRNTG